MSESGRDVTSGIALAVLEDLNRILEGKNEAELDCKSDSMDRLNAHDQ